MHLGDGREITEHYTPEQVRAWLTPRIGPNGVETFEPYNGLNLVYLAESFVAYADRLQRELAQAQRDLRLAQREADIFAGDLANKRTWEP